MDNLAHHQPRVNTSIENVEQQRTSTPSLEKYGAIVLQDGFTQWPQAVESYLNTLNICPSAKLLVIILLSYLREFEQEVFPSVRTLAKRLDLGERQTRNLTRLLAHKGLIVKIERYGERGQTTNGYSLAPLLTKVAAWKDATVADQLAQAEAERDLPFVPADLLDEAAIVIEEEYGEIKPEQPRAEREHADRLRARWEKLERAGAEWSVFAEAIAEAAERAGARREMPTLTGRAFTKLVPYFFSSLDYLLSRVQAKHAPIAPSAAVNNAATASVQTTTTTATPATAERKERAPIPQLLARRITDLCNQFHDSAIKSSVQRAANLMQSAHINLDQMLESVQKAREIANQRQVKKRDRHGQFNRMPYFFSVLESMLIGSNNLTQSV